MRAATFIASSVLATWLCTATTAAAQSGSPGDQRLRVAILPFANQTRNPALAGVASRLEDASAAAAADVAGAALVRVSTVAGIKATDAVKTVGARTGATIIVRGTISVQGDMVELDATAVNPADGKVIHHLPVERAPVSDPGPAIDRLSGRIAGMLALHANPERSSPHLYSVPMLKAYRLEMRADSLFYQGRPADALPLLYEAAQIDSMNLMPLLLAAAIHGNAGRAGPRDSLLTIVDAKQDRLTEIERLNLPWLRDVPAKGFIVARTAARMDPASDQWAYAVGFKANGVGYFEDAVAALARRAEFAARGSYSAKVWAPWRGQYMEALHGAGDFARELSEVKLARAELPQATVNTYYVQELRALAALGRIDELRAVTTRLMAMRPDSVPVVQIQTAGFELKRHGHKAEGEKLIAEVADFAAAHESAIDSLAFATALALARRYDVALPRLEKLATGSSAFVRVGRYAVFSVFAGRRDVGDRMMTRLAELGDVAPSHTWRGLLSASTGDCQGAVAHFRMAIERGQLFSTGFWHWDPSTEPIWGCEAFEKLPSMRAP
jgi:TolB-like protein